MGGLRGLLGREAPVWGAPWARGEVSQGLRGRQEESGATGGVGRSLAGQQCPRGGCRPGEGTRPRARQDLELRGRLQQALRWESVQQVFNSVCGQTSEEHQVKTEEKPPLFDSVSKVTQCYFMFSNI